MSIRTLEWHKGAPEKLKPGMLVMRGGRANDICVVGSLMYRADEESLMDNAVAWAWLVQPHEIEWLESMAEAHGVGK